MSTAQSAEALLETLPDRLRHGLNADQTFAVNADTTTPFSVRGPLRDRAAHSLLSISRHGAGYHILGLMPNGIVKPSSYCRLLSVQYDSERRGVRQVREGGVPAAHPQPWPVG